MKKLDHMALSYNKMLSVKMMLSDKMLSDYTDCVSVQYKLFLCNMMWLDNIMLSDNMMLSDNILSEFMIFAKHHVIRLLVHRLIGLHHVI
jgi:hypothetical protein